MKAFFLTGSILLTVIILILAFENMGISCGDFLFVFSSIETPFFIVVGLCGVGILTGIFYTGLVMQILNSGKDEESPGNEW